jgi:hypothetical protein
MLMDRRVQGRRKLYIPQPVETAKLKLLLARNLDRPPNPGFLSNLAGFVHDMVVDASRKPVREAVEFERVGRTLDKRRATRSFIQEELDE